MNGMVRAWTPLVAIGALTVALFSNASCHVDVDLARYVVGAIAAIGGYGVWRLGNTR